MLKLAQEREKLSQLKEKNLNRNKN